MTENELILKKLELIQADLNLIQIASNNTQLEITTLKKKVVEIGQQTQTINENGQKIYAVVSDPVDKKIPPEKLLAFFIVFPMFLITSGALANVWRIDEWGEAWITLAVLIVCLILLNRLGVGQEFISLTKE